MTPADSWPSTTGNFCTELLLCVLCHIWMSEPHTPTECTRTSTSPAAAIEVREYPDPIASASSAYFTRAFIGTARPRPCLLSAHPSLDRCTAPARRRTQAAAAGTVRGQNSLCLLYTSPSP